ncbi:SPOR domain-containing protein [Rhodoferax ferrireducens]|uniref:SPOR domain-containing protein n=1 Tax=Rhodoferax ferrireducens TaxID=192843 RepID=UPI00298E5F4B|nr:SPOR domain-containing protein [Rhodoferax ferrireducens]WPC65959.1 SPOR domain-containing protein [Rhodoferax ferrireducens]
MTSTTTFASPDITVLDRSPENATAALYRAAIGPINSGYYVPVFVRFEAVGRAGPSWNWAASLYTLNWMIFRHLWAAAGVYVTLVLGLFLLVFGMGRLLLHGSEAVDLVLMVVCCGLSYVLPGVFGNAIFHAKSRQKMAAALSATPTLADACKRLNQQASSRQRFLRLASANLALAAIAALAYVAWPTATMRPVSPAAIPVIGNLASPVPAPVVAVQSINIDAVPTAMPTPTPAASLVAGEPASVPAGGKLIVPLAKIVTAAASVTPQNPTTLPVTGQRYFINVGLFAKDRNARNAYAKLRAAGLPAFKQTLKGRTRVRVGPFATQVGADAAAEQIHALQLDAVVFQL